MMSMILKKKFFIIHIRNNFFFLLSHPSRDYLSIEMKISIWIKIEKIDIWIIIWINDRSYLISSWLCELSEAGPSDIKTVLAIFKAFQEITEAHMDMIAMYLRDSGIPARDDYTNIERIPGFSTEQKELLRGMNGLRNRIIHRYNGTDEKLALSGIAESLPEILSITKVFETWVHQN
jgi:uncharacterized protein YutE (UPF0331/DUF86 family)